MSKNKDIETLHRITGEPYRVCRKVLDALEALGEAVHSLIDDLCEAFRSIDWAGLVEAALEQKRLQDERLIQCTAEHCTEDGCENCAGYEPMGGSS